MPLRSPADIVIGPRLLREARAFALGRPCRRSAARYGRGRAATAPRRQLPAIRAAAATLVAMTSPDEPAPAALRAIAADADALLDRLDDTANALLSSGRMTPEQAFHLGGTASQFAQAVRALKETAIGVDR